MTKSDKSNQEVAPENQPIIITEVEMENLKEIIETYNQCSGAFGQVEVQKMSLNQQLVAVEEQRSSVEEEWKANQAAETAFFGKLNKKYGPGSINPQTGEYTPQPEQDQQPPQAMA